MLLVKFKSRLLHFVALECVALKLETAVQYTVQHTILEKIYFETCTKL